MVWSDIEFLCSPCSRNLLVVSRMLTNCRVHRIPDLLPTRPVLMQADDFVLVMQRSFLPNFPVTLPFLLLFLLSPRQLLPLSLRLLLLFSEVDRSDDLPWTSLFLGCRANILDLVGKRWHLVIDCISYDLCRCASNDVRVCEFHELSDEVLPVD